MRHRLLEVLQGVRMRTALVATSVVAVALVLGALTLVRVQRSVGIDNLDTAITTRAGDLALLLNEGAQPGTLDVARQEEALVQVVDANGEVVAASENVEGLAPVAEASAIGIDTVSGLPVDPDEEFRLLTNKVLTDDGVLTIIVAASLEPLEENVDVLRGNLMIALPVMSAFVGIVSWFIVGRALRPVDAIRGEVEVISDRQLDRRVPEPRAHDEIGRLARTMNTMLTRLQEAWEREERFVADASHELRSPLTVMRSQIEVDRRHPETADAVATQATLLAEIDTLQRLIDDLLHLARGGTAPHERPTVDLDEIVLAEARLMRYSSDVEIDTSAVSAGQLQGNPGELRRLVRNLVDNAIRHAHSEVTVSLHEDGDEVVLVVADDGPGVPPEAAEAIFERFVSLDEARSHGAGSGLGLAIARDVVERHQGTISLGESSTGARFEVRLRS